MVGGGEGACHFGQVLHGKVTFRGRLGGIDRAVRAVAGTEGNAAGSAGAEPTLYVESAVAAAYPGAEFEEIEPRAETGDGLRLGIRGAPPGDDGPRSADFGGLLTELLARLPSSAKAAWTLRIDTAPAEQPSLPALVRALRHHRFLAGLVLMAVLMTLVIWQGSFDFGQYAPTSP